MLSFIITAFALSPFLSLSLPLSPSPSLISKFFCWLQALRHGIAQFEAPGVKLSLSVLRHANRIVGINVMEMEKSLQRALDHCADATDFLREFPVEAIEGAPSLAQLQALVDACFAVAPRKIRNSEHAFKLERVVAFLAALERAVASRASELLEYSAGALGSGGAISSATAAASASGGVSGRLMALPYRDFKARVEDLTALFRRWLEGFFGPLHPALASMDKAPRALSSGSAGGGIVPLADFLKEQTQMKGRLSQALEPRSAAKLMRELLEGLDKSALLPRLFERVRLAAAFRLEHEEL